MLFGDFPTRIFGKGRHGRQYSIYLRAARKQVSIWVSMYLKSPELTLVRINVTRLKRGLGGGTQPSDSETV